jgi:4-diphosphocytidyl-2C-methyl-D-erythritol kinase
LTASAFAAAKVNLYLHVAPPTPDGYHPIASLMAFADVGDEVTAAPADRLSLAIEGPFGAGLSAEDDNLVLRAARALGCRTLDGGGMAVHQAVDAFRLFTGQEPDAARMRAHFARLVAG